MPDADRFRLEPVLDDPSLVIGLQMQVADPAWMLARQRHFGELRAEDVGSPATAKMWTLNSPLTRYRAGGPDGHGQLLDLAHAPLEALVENEHQPRDEPNIELAAIAGRHLLRLLADPMLDAYRAALVAHFALSTPVGAARSGWLELAPGRVPDGQAAYRAFDTALRRGATSRLPAEPPPPQQAAARTAAETAARAFLAWYDGVSGRMLPEGGAWVPDRLEYRLSIAGPTAAGELVLSADRYDDGRLDWYAFDVAPGASLGASADPGVTAPVKRTFLPAPVTFRGMPSPRLWELEDSAVDLGAVNAGPEDLATMLAVEFATAFGNDFFLVPLPLQIGTVSRVGALVVSDTFGERFLISPSSEVDGGLRLFEHEAADRSREHALVAFPVAVGTGESAPLEDLALVRDEGANLCWAIERTALDPAGMRLDRGSAAASARPPEPPPADSATPSRWRLRTSVAPHWYPLLPAGASPSALRLGRLRALAAEAAQGPPLGRVLTELGTLPLPVEEVTRDGHRIIRATRAARGVDGVHYLWTGRRAGPAPETGGSGLVFDTVDHS